MTHNGQLHAFITQISGRINRLEEYALENGLEEPVSTAELRIIQTVGLEGSEKMSHIAAALGITLATLTVSCDKLESKGFIVRRRDPDDKRTVRVGLTEKGMVAYRFHASFVEGIMDYVLSELSEDERAVLRRGILRINTLFEDMTKETEYV